MPEYDVYRCYAAVMPCPAFAPTRREIKHKKPPSPRTTAVAPPRNQTLETKLLVQTAFVSFRFACLIPGVPGAGQNHMAEMAEGIRKCTVPHPPIVLSSASMSRHPLALCLDQQPLFIVFYLRLSRFPAGPFVAFFPRFWRRRLVRTLLVAWTVHKLEANANKRRTRRKKVKLYQKQGFSE